MGQPEITITLRAFGWYRVRRNDAVLIDWKNDATTIWDSCERAEEFAIRCAYETPGVAIEVQGTNDVRILPWETVEFIEAARASRKGN